MTRDDAIQDTYKSFRSCEPYDGYSNKELLDVAANNIDLFIALGMLKLEEPKSAEVRATDKAVRALADAGWSLNVINVLNRAGLKIVEK